MDATEDFQTTTIKRGFTLNEAPRFQFGSVLQWQPSAITVTYVTSYGPDGVPRHEPPSWEGKARIVRKDDTLGDTTRDISCLWGCPQKIMEALDKFAAEKDPRR